MATLLSWLSLGERSRTIRLTCFDCDVIIVIVDWLYRVNFRTIEKPYRLV